MIRPYVASDLAELLESWYRASLIAHSFLSDEFLAQERVLIAKQWLPASETTVSIVDEQVVGFLSSVGNEVGAIFVHPESQGAGLGRELMDLARATRPFLELDVFEANAIGRRFYAAYGFEQIDRRADEETGQMMLRLRLG